MSNKSQSEQFQAAKKRVNGILRNEHILSSRIVVTTDLDGLRMFYQIGTIHLISKSTDKRVRKLEKRLNNYIKVGNHEQKLKDRKMISETPSIDSRKLDRCLCLVVSDMKKIRKCNRKAPADNPNHLRVGISRKGLDGKKWVVAKTWIPDRT